MQVDPKQAKSKDQVESKKKKKNKEKKEKHQNLMKELPPTAYSCSAHETDYLRIFARPNKNPPTCKSCGFKLQGKYGYLCCPKSSGCFQLCSTCKVCTKNHMLRNIISLKMLEGDLLYADNKFICHGCKQEKLVGEKGVLHCQPCKFSICWDCQQRTEALWDQAIKNEE